MWSSRSGGASSPFTNCQSGLKEQRNMHVQTPGLLNPRQKESKGCEATPHQNQHSSAHHALEAPYDSVVDEPQLS